MSGLDGLRERGGMAWIEQESAWVAVPDDIVKALSKDGFEEYKREMTTSRRDRRPAGGVWQGINPRTGSEASAIWVNRRGSAQAIVFIAIDGEPLDGAPSSVRDPLPPSGASTASQQAEEPPREP